MNSTRFFRPLARAAFRQPTAVRPSIMARPALAATQSQSQKAEVAPQQMVRWHMRSAREAYAC
jgi:F-type H+-transporting ATPase subunit 8